MKPALSMRSPAMIALAILVLAACEQATAPPPVSKVEPAPIGECPDEKYAIKAMSSSAR
jgi:hypothetical protein